MKVRVRVKDRASNRLKLRIRAKASKASRPKLRANNPVSRVLNPVVSPVNLVNVWPTCLTNSAAIRPDKIKWTRTGC